MGIGLRYYLFEEDGTLRHVAQRIVEGLAHGKDRLPQYAGQSLRSIEVVLETVDGKAVEIVKLSGGIWHFDEKGRTRQDWIESAITASETHEALRQASTTGPVVDITGRIARRQWEEHNRWEPTPADINRIIHIIWPETAGRPVKRPKTISGVRERRPPMTLEAKRTISKCREDVWSVVSRLDDLSEPSLKAVIGKIEGLAEKNDDLGALEIWEGIRAAAEKILAVHKARRSNKGKWFAVVERAIWRPGASTTGRVDVLDHARCNGRKAAITKCREFLRKYADQFDENTSIDVQMYPEIEWLALPYSKDPEPE